MVLCDAGRGMAMLSVAVALLLHHLSMAQLYAVALTEGTLFTFFSIADAASLPSVVEREQIASAFAQREMAWSGSGTIAPGLGGLLYQAGRAIPFAVDGVSYAGSVISLLLVRRPLQSERM